MTTCAVDRCIGKHYAHGFCRSHYKLDKRWGDPLGGPGSGSYPHARGAASPNWHGDRVGYMAAHDRVRKAKGNASEHLCPCGKPAESWAYDGTDPAEKVQTVDGYSLAFSLDVDRYNPMCMPCHNVLDHTKVR